MNEVEINLIRKIAAGDTAAFEVAYKNYFPTLVTAAFRITGSEDDANDIAQNILQNLWSRRAFLDIHTSLEAWLVTSVKHASYKHILKTKRTQEATEVYTQLLDPFTLSATDADLTRGTVYDAIDKLSPRRREIFTMHKIENKSHPEIAAQLNISIQTVKNTMVDAYKELIPILKANKLLLWEIILWVTFNIKEL
ncbi:RNA polymerase sigma factor [Dawidia soli]|uniref:Sigma-70 family RNA polymerase sigma factor n=1 Tax=Dawidia soli TaxID=2782352 RepID=A0AAP2DEJ6_9BACT|nr:sigma-70 family RNA polymerase sigma factor [Dawidia soli]MBT1690343.1 sigma-70 family RNA polymerase sigma factor [Dawidia soli]